MSRAAISTGNILFNTVTPTKEKKSREGGATCPMHIALIADFSGRGSRKDCNIASLNKRRAIEIDRDNFEEVFTTLEVRLKLPVAPEPIAFREFDDLHPDYLYEQLPIFEQLRTLKRKLKKPELFQQAAKEIQQWQRFLSESKLSSSILSNETGKTQASDLPPNMLDAILSQSTSIENYQNSPIGNLDQIVKDIVAPYVEPKTDPNLPAMLQAIDESTSESLRKIMHASDFQHLEAAWRSVYFLVRRLETNHSLKLFLFDISREEILKDISNKEDLRETSLYQLLVENTRVPGSTPFSILQFDLVVDDTQENIRIASAQANLAAANQGIAIAAASEKLAGCEGLADRENLEDWHYRIDNTIADNWSNLRQQASSEHLALVAPRFLLRLPYGKKSSPIDSFDFEELTSSNAHPYYLWGNGAYLVTLILAQSYSRWGWDFHVGQLQQIDDLPLHIYEEGGESLAKACTEIYMPDSIADTLASVGILPLRSVKGKASVVIPRFRTIADSGRDIFFYEFNAL